MKELVDQVLARLREQKIEVPEAEVEARLKMLVENYRVPEGEARRSVLNYFLKEHGVTLAPVVRAAPEKVTVSQISEPGRWVNLEVKVLDLWEPANETISQTGLVGDSSGTMKFVKWAKSGLSDMEVGKSYLLKSVVTDEYQGRFSIKLNRTSQIEALDKEVEAAAPAQQGPTEDLSVGDIKEPGRWINIRAKVVQLWEPTSEAISQSGLIGDETGIVKFIKWTKADLPNLVEGRSYLFKNVVTDEFQGRFSVKLNRTSQIEELKEDITVEPQSVEFSGAIVEVQKGSGLIKRCPICKRVLNRGTCINKEHGNDGKVEGVYDLRIKAVLDDGRRAQDILINRETTERLVGLTLDQAKQMAMEALDHEVVRGLIDEHIVGKYYTVTGRRVDRYIIVESINEMPPVSSKEVDDLIGIVEVG